MKTFCPHSQMNNGVINASTTRIVNDSPMMIPVRPIPRDIKPSRVGEIDEVLLGQLPVRRIDMISA